MRRRLLLLAALLGFLVLSAGLARFLSTENAERTAILRLLSAQGRGDTQAMLRLLQGCDPTCGSAVSQNARTLQGRGELKILNLTSHTAYSLAGAAGQSRVAWKQGSRLPVVQCVRVQRTGDVLTGLSIRLLAVSLPIAGTANCP